MDNYGPNPLTTQVQQARQVSQELSDRQFKKGKSKKIFILLIIIALGAIGAFLIFRGIGGADGEATPTPTEDSFGFIKSPSPSPAGSSEPDEKVDRAGVDIEIQNGTGISGEAGLLETKLKALDYSKIEVGNASSQNATAAVVTFSDDLSGTVVKEITDLLEDTYTDVTTKTSGSLSGDVLIVTGLRSGQTAKPSAAATATAKPSASASSSASPTATATASPSN